MQTTCSDSSIKCLALNINDPSTGSKKANVRLVLEYSITGIVCVWQSLKHSSRDFLGYQRQFVLLNRALQLQI